MKKVDAIEFGSRERRALLEENVGMREWRRRRIEWRAVQALVDAVIPSAA